MLRIDRRLIDRILDETPSSEATYAIDRYLSPRDRNDPEFGFTRPEMNLRLFLFYVGEVGNGGHAQFFLNPIGDYAVRTLAALQEMGLGDLAELLSEAISIFEEGLIPSSQDERESVIELMSPEALSVWSRLDKRVWNSGGSAHDQVLRYLRVNRSQLLQPETA